MPRNTRDHARKRRKMHIRKKLGPVPSRPRLCVFRSSNHIYAQVIDDAQGCTLASASTLNSGFEKEAGHTGNVASARKVGLMIAERARAAGVEAVVFDRNGFLYHGRIKALADAAREGGLQF